MRRVRTSELIPGMTTAEDVYNYNGQLILPRGLTLTDRAITRLEFYSILSVRIQDEKAPSYETEEVDLSTTRSERIRASEEFRRFQESFDENLQNFKDSINDIVDLNANIDTDTMLTNTLAILSEVTSSYQAFDILHNMREYDDLTFAHSLNVALICNIFAQWLGWSEQDQNLLTLCGLLHDIGKLKIPDTIIKKPDRLTDDEYKIIKTHTAEGFHILKSHNINSHIVNSALMHHEKCDGTGYPLGLTGDKIDRYAKAVAIADVYDAMTSARIYRGPLCPFRVIEIFEAEGLQKYAPEYILTFLENIVITYLHNNVMLSNKEVATVMFINKHKLSKPIVKKGDTVIDLSKEQNLFIDTIL